MRPSEVKRTMRKTAMFIFLDTETTGTGPDDRLCQIAFKMETGTPVCELFNPGMPISVDAMSIHHITDKMVRDKSAFQGSKVHQHLSELLQDERSVVVAHNARFDVEMLRRENLQPRKGICTLKLARYLDSNGVIPKYSLQYLRYYLGLDITATAHDALGDILVLEAVFKRIYDKFMTGGRRDDRVNEMIKISNSPIRIPRMPFGKHKGQLFDEIPRDYLEWLLGTGLDEDMDYTVRTQLGR